MQNIVTPVKVKELERLLIDTGYDVNKRQYLIDGFTQGFDLEYGGSRERQDRSNNIPFTIGNKFELWSKIMKEVKEGHYAGPFEEIPFEFYIQSPIGLVPKDGGRKTRLIFHLSYDFEKSSGNPSLNACIPPEKCSVKYHDLDEAVRSSINWCKIINTGERQIFYGKTDVQSAFRLVPLRFACWMLLVMMAIHPIIGKTYFFMDKCLPFGASISCKIFQEFSDALRHIVEGKTMIYLAITNYLDDFLFVAMTIRKCNHLMKQFLDICSIIGVPISHEKTVWATRIIIFLGFLLNRRDFSISIPEEKRQKAINSLQAMISKRKATVKDIQSLAGLLNFLNRAIVPGRAFTRRMYAKYEGIVKKQQKRLKAYHHVKIDREFKADCEAWLELLNSDGMAAVVRSFVDFEERGKTSTELAFFSDVSLNPLLGFGAHFDRQWTYGQWPKGFVETRKPSIEYLELYALVVAVFIWGKNLANQRFTIFCDNEAVVHMINNYASSCPNCMVLIRLLVLKTLQYNFRVFTKYVRSQDNDIADCLSRLQFHHFAQLRKQYRLKAVAEPIPVTLDPITKVWKDF